MFAKAIPSSLKKTKDISHRAFRHKFHVRLFGTELKNQFF